VQEVVRVSDDYEAERRAAVNEAYDALNAAAPDLPPAEPESQRNQLVIGASPDELEAMLRAGELDEGDVIRDGEGEPHRIVHVRSRQRARARRAAQPSASVSPWGERGWRKAE
jgi:hypothetical protein